MDDLPKTLRNKAMDWLAQREHSHHEIKQKLERWLAQQKRSISKKESKSPIQETLLLPNSEFAKKAIEATLEWLEEYDFVSDERCARLFVNSYISRGYGPLRIRQELIFRKGLAESLVEQKMADSGCDWGELAKQVHQRKFSKPATELKAKAKQLRFLQSRGFLADQCYQALNMDCD